MITPVIILFILILVRPNSAMLETPKTDPNEIVDAVNNISVADLQQLAAGGLLCIDMQYSMDNAQSIDDISYDITADGNILIIITCTSIDGKVAFYAADTKSVFTKLFIGGYRSYNPYIYYGIFDGNTLSEEPTFSKSGKLAIDPVVAYASEKFGF